MRINASRPSHPPIPDQIARRIAERDDSALFTTPPALRNELTYTVGDSSFATAYLRSQLLPREIWLDRPITEDFYEIGRFHPGSHVWRFYPEFVKPEEALAMHVLFTSIAEDRLASAKVDEKSPLFFDMFHELTAKAHRETEALFAGTTLAERLIKGNVEAEHATARMDEASSVIMVMLPAIRTRRRLSAAGINFGLRLDARFDSVLDDQGRRLSALTVPLARCAPGQEQVWEPDPGLIAKEEWEVLRDGVDILQTCEAANHNFRAEVAAVAYEYGEE